MPAKGDPCQREVNPKMPQWKPVLDDNRLNQERTRRAPKAKASSVWPVYLCLFLGASAFFVSGPVRVKTAYARGANATMIGTAGAFTGLANMLVSTVLVSIAGALGLKNTFMLATAFCAAAAYTIAVSTNVHLFLVLSALTGVYCKSAGLLTKLYITESFTDPKVRIGYLKKIPPMFSGAATAFLMIGGWVSQHADNWTVSAAMAAFTVAMIFVFLSEPVKQFKPIPNDGKSHKSKTSNSDITITWTEKLLLAVRVSLNIIPIQIFAASVGIFMVKTLKVETSALGRAISFVTAMGTIVQLTIPALTKDVPARTLTVVSGMICAMGYFAATHMEHDLVSWIVCVMIASNSASQAMLNSEVIVQESMPGGQGHSFFALIQSVVQTMTQICCGYLMDNGVSVWLVASAVAVLGALSMLTHTSKKKTE